MLGQLGGAAQKNAPVIGIVPVEVGLPDGTARGGLAHLARSTDQSHLAVALEMVSQDGDVKARSICLVDRYHVIRKLVQTVLRCRRTWSRSHRGPYCPWF